MYIRVSAATVALMILSACTPATRSWRLQGSGTGDVLMPPAVRTSIKVPLCEEKLTLTPAQVLMRRTEIINAEDEGCIPHGRSDAILDEAVQHQAISPAALPSVRYGYSLAAGHADLVPGWRLRVITLLTKSGSFRLKETAEQTGSNTLTVRTDGDFLGHETAYYAVIRRTREPGVSVRLESVEAAVGGATEKRKDPKERLFDLPPWARHVRLVFLTRASSADHDMAIVGARTYWDLEQATAPVQVTPQTGCRTTANVYCAWVPAGIAVTPEVQVTLNGAGKWVALPATLGSLVPDAKAASVIVRRAWRGRMLPITATNVDIRHLSLVGGEQITLGER
jgi:hypothetical protein